MKTNPSTFQTALAMILNLPIVTAVVAYFTEAMRDFREMGIDNQRRNFSGIPISVFGRVDSGSDANVTAPAYRQPPSCIGDQAYDCEIVASPGIENWEKDRQTRVRAGILESTAAIFQQIRNTLTAAINRAFTAMKPSWPVPSPV